MATEQMKHRAAEWEAHVNKEEKKMLRERANMVKKGGFKDEKDYFTNVNPFTGKRRKESTPRSKALNK